MSMCKWAYLVGLIFENWTPRKFPTSYNIIIVQLYTYTPIMTLATALSLALTKWLASNIQDGVVESRCLAVTLCFLWTTYEEAIL